MVAEMMSFGHLSRWYSSLADRALRNRIAVPLGLPETVLVPLVRHVTDIAAEARAETEIATGYDRSECDPGSGQDL